MPSMTTELVVKLLDGVTKPAAAAARAILGIGRAQDKVNRGAGLGERIGVAAAANNARMDSLRGKMVDAVGAGYLLKEALTAPINAAAEFETILEDMGQKADIPRAALAALGKDIQQVARETNQGTMSIAGAVDNLLGMGATKDVALAAAAPIGQAATAYRASTDDLAKAAYAAVDNLKVPSQDIGKAIDAMAAAGKMGAFELRDMAQYFPSLGAAYQGLGQTGVSSVADLAAALQVVRKGTGDASSAATNLQNVLQKIYAPATVKSFKKLGINIRKEMKRAAKEGKTPIEAIADITNKALKGDLSRLGEVFEDAQVQGGLRALIQNMETYRKIRDGAMDSEGTVADDYARRIQTAAGAQIRWAAATQNLSIAFGAALVPALSDALDTVIPLLNKIGDFAAANPELTRNVILAASALVAFRVAAIGVQWSAGFALGSVLSLAGGMVKVGAGAKAAAGIAMVPFSRLGTHIAGVWQTAALRFGMMRREIAAGAIGMSGVLQGTFATMGRAVVQLLAPMALVRGAMTALKLAVIGTGIGAVLVGIAMAGAWIYQNWNGIKEMFVGIGEGIRNAFPGLGPIIDGVSGAVSTLVGWFQKMTGPIDATAGAWRSFGVSVGQGIGGFLADIVALPGKAMAAVQPLIDFFANLTIPAPSFEAIIGAFNGLLSTVQAIASGIKAAVDGVISAISSLGGAQRTASQTAAAMAASPRGQAAAASAAAGVPAPTAGGRRAFGSARAAGGPVWAGQRVLVGEKGPEIIDVARRGIVTPNDELGASAPRAPVAGPTTITLAPSYHITGASDEARLRAILAEHDRALMAELNGSMAGRLSS